MNKAFCLLIATAMGCGAALATPATYTVDDDHTYVTFAISHFGAAVNRGRFDTTSGSVSYDPDAHVGQIDITVQVQDAHTGAASLDQHLMQPVFFDAAQYPTMRFISNHLVFEGDRLVEVPGQFTMRGQTHPVTFKARQFHCYDSPIAHVQSCGGDFEATIDRTLWGMDYLVDSGMPRDVYITATIEAHRQ